MKFSIIKATDLFYIREGGFAVFQIAFGIRIFCDEDVGSVYEHKIDVVDFFYRSVYDDLFEISNLRYKSAPNLLDRFESSLFCVLAKLFTCAQKNDIMVIPLWDKL